MFPVQTCRSVKCNWIRCCDLLDGKLPLLVDFLLLSKFLVLLKPPTLTSSPSFPPFSSPPMHRCINLLLLLSISSGYFSPPTRYPPNLAPLCSLGRDADPGGFDRLENLTNRTGDDTHTRSRRRRDSLPAGGSKGPPSTGRRRRRTRGLSSSLPYKLGASVRSTSL